MAAESILSFCLFVFLYLENMSRPLIRAIKSCMMDGQLLILFLVELNRKSTGESLCNGESVLMFENFIRTYKPRNFKILELEEIIYKYQVLTEEHWTTVQSKTRLCSVLIRVVRVTDLSFATDEALFGERNGDCRSPYTSFPHFLVISLCWRLLKPNCLLSLPFTWHLASALPAT